MTRILFLVLTFLAQAVTGQPTSAPGQTPMDIEGERRRIQAQRLQEAERHTLQEAACYARFAVSDCLSANRAQHRRVLDQLKKQESAIHDQERKQKAFEQIQRVRDKATANDSAPAALP